MVVFYTSGECPERVSTGPPDTAPREENGGLIRTPAAGGDSQNITMGQAYHDRSKGKLRER